MPTRSSIWEASPGGPTQLSHGRSEREHSLQRGRRASPRSKANKQHCQQSDSRGRRACPRENLSQLVVARQAKQLLFGLLLPLLLPLLFPVPTWHLFVGWMHLCIECKQASSSFGTHLGWVKTFASSSKDRMAMATAMATCWCDDYL